MTPDAISKIYELTQKERNSRYRSPTSEAVTLNDSARTRARLIQHLETVSNQDFIEATAQRLKNGDFEETIQKILQRATQLKKEEEKLEAEKNRKRAKRKAFDNSEPYKILRVFYAFRTGGQGHSDDMKQYRNKSISELKELFKQLQCFDVSLTPLPGTYGPLMKPLQTWILEQLALKGTQ